jgi:hypothetical protein
MTISTVGDARVPEPVDPLTLPLPERPLPITRGLSASGYRERALATRYVTHECDCLPSAGAHYFTPGVGLVLVAKDGTSGPCPTAREVIRAPTLTSKAERVAAENETKRLAVSRALEADERVGRIGPRKVIASELELPRSAKPFWPLATRATSALGRITPDGPLVTSVILRGPNWQALWRDGKFISAYTGHESTSKMGVLKWRLGLGLEPAGWNEPRRPAKRPSARRGDALGGSYSER